MGLITPLVVRAPGAPRPWGPHGGSGPWCRDGREQVAGGQAPGRRQVPSWASVLGAQLSPLCSHLAELGGELGDSSGVLGHAGISGRGGRGLGCAGWWAFVPRVHPGSRGGYLGHLPGAKSRDHYYVAVACPQMVPETGTRRAPCAGAAVPACGHQPVLRLPDHHLCVCVRARLPATLRSPVKHDPAFSSGTSCLTLAQRRQLPSSKGFVVNLGDSEAPLASSLVSSELISVAGSSPLQVGLSCDRFPSSLLQP